MIPRFANEASGRKFAAPHQMAFLITNVVLWLNASALIQKPHNAGNIVDKIFVITSAFIFISARGVRRSSSIIFLLMAIELLVCGIFSDAMDFSWLYYVSGFASLLSGLLFLLPQLTLDDAEFLLTVFSFAPLAVVALGVPYELVGLTKLFPPDYDNVPRLGGDTIPAFLAGFSYIGAFSATAMFEYSLKPRFAILAVADTVITLLTGSRTPLVMVGLLCVAVLFLSRRWSPLAKVLGAVYGTIGAGVIVIVAGQGTIERFQSNSSSGRNKIWQAMLSVADQHPIFGVGLGNQQLYFTQILTKTTGTIATHNEYIRLSLECGYVGAIGFGFALSTLLISRLRDQKISRPLIFMTVVASMLAYAATDNIFGNHMIFILLAGYSAAILPKVAPRVAIDVPIYAFAENGERRPQGRTVGRSD